MGSEGKMSDDISKKGSKDDDTRTLPDDKEKDSEDPEERGDESQSAKKKKSKESVSSVGSTESKGKEKGKDKVKGKLADQRGSLKFGDEEPPKKAKKKEQPEEKGKQDKGEFDASKYKKNTAVIFHDNDDLMWGKGVGFNPGDAVPKKGPGVTEEMEKMYGPCALLTEFKYTTWADTIVPLKNHNLVQGFNEMSLCLIELAANGGESLSHEDAFLAVNFLSNVRNDLGEVPPNILGLMEHIDFLTKSDGTAGSGSPKFKHMDNCELKDWY